MTSFMVRKQYIYLRTFSGNQALQNKRAQRKKETLAAGQDDLKGNLSLFWATSMRQSRQSNVLTMDVKHGRVHHEKSGAYDDQTELKRHCGKNTRYSLSALKVCMAAPQDIPFLTGSIVSLSVVLMAQIAVCDCWCEVGVVRTHELHLTNQVPLNNFITTLLILLMAARALMCGWSLPCYEVAREFQIAVSGWFLGHC